MTDDDLEEQVQTWLFYCWLCEQWRPAAGPWCASCADQARTDVCIFKENPGWALGVPRQVDPELARTYPWRGPLRERNQ